MPKYIWLSQVASWGKKDKMLNYLGIILYVFWLVLLLLKYHQYSAEKPFIFKKVFFGNIIWYKNFRNLLLLVSLFLICIYTPLKWIYLLGTITMVISLALAAINFFARRGTFKGNSQTALISIVLGFIFFYLYYKI